MLTGVASSAAAFCLERCTSSLLVSMRVSAGAGRTQRTAVDLQGAHQLTNLVIASARPRRIKAVPLAGKEMSLCLVNTSKTHRLLGGFGPLGAEEPWQAKPRRLP